MDSKLLAITPIKSLATQLHLNFQNVNSDFYLNDTGDNKQKHELLITQIETYEKETEISGELFKIWKIFKKWNHKNNQAN